jgi:RNA binding exosome subunit
MSAICVDPVIIDMKVGIEGSERETIIDPLYKKVDKNGRVYLNIDLAGQEALILVVKPEPEDKIKYIKVGRS